MAGRVLAVDVERVRSAVYLGIPVRRADQRDHDLVLAHLLALELEGFQGHPVGALDGRVEPQHLLDHLGRHRRRVGAQGLPLRGVAEQRQHAVADQVDRGLEPRDQQQAAQRQDLLGPHLIALRGDQLAQDVVARLAPAQLEEVLEQLPQYRVAGHQLPRVPQRPDAVERAADEHAVPREVGRTRVRDPQQVGDDGDRQRHGERGHQVELARGGGRVEQFADGALDPACIGGHRPRAERGCREPPQPRVVRRVHAQERQIELVVRGGNAVLLLGTDPEAPVTQHAVADPVAGGHPVAEPGRHQRALRPKPVVDRVRVDAAGAQLDQRHRVAPDVAGVGDARAGEVQARGEGEHLTEVGHAPPWRDNRALQLFSPGSRGGNSATTQ